MSDHEPLECPFCGGNLASLQHTTLVFMGGAFWVECPYAACAARGRYAPTGPEAVALWNAPILERRKLHARVGRLETKARAAVSACTDGLTELVAELEASDESK